MSFDSANLKTINTVLIEQDTHLWLLAQANKAGMDLRYFAGMLLDRARTEYTASENSASDGVAVFDLFHQVAAKKAMVERVYKIASIYLDGHTQDVEMAEALAKACERAELDYDEVLRTSASNPFSSLSQYEIGFTKMGECVRWLSSFLAEHQNIPSRVVYSLADKQGFTEKTVRRAVAYINNHNHGYRVTSKRSSSGWNMVLEKDEEASENLAETLFVNPNIQFEEKA